MIQNLFFFFFFRGVGSISQPRLNIFTVDNMAVMICLGQGGLRSPSGKGGYVFGSVGLSVCGQHYSKSYKWIGMKFYGVILGSIIKNWLNFGGDLGILRWVNEQKNTIIVVAYKEVNIAIYSSYLQMLRSCNTHHNQFFNWLPYWVNRFTLLMVNDLH